MATVAGSDTRVLIARNPATEQVLGQVERTPPEALPEIVARARAAQGRWATRPWHERRAVLERFWRVLAGEAEDWAAAIEAEVGKPRCEAMAGDVVAALDAVRWTVKHAGRVLADRRIGAGVQALLSIPSATLSLRPYGVIGMIGTWNYPLFLSAPPIAQALAAGNAVVWKPSELAPLAGVRLQESLERAKVPDGLVTAVFGGPEVGAALVEAGIDKGVFTGGIGSGRSVLGALGARGVPSMAELSGFDPAIVLPDAPRKLTVRALVWGAFVGCGQTCVAIKRIYVVGDPAPWAEAIVEATGNLRMGNPLHGLTDIGPMITEEARDRFHRTIRATVEAGAQLLFGGAVLTGPGWFYRPAVLLAETPGPEQVLAGAFGPVVLIRGVATVDEALDAANSTGFGLAASVWGADRAAATRVADRLQAGMIAVNDAVTPCAHAAAPFGGVKSSGFGRHRGALGLAEFTQPRTLHVHRAGRRCPQWFPYLGKVEKLLRLYRRLIHGRV
jgi:acyl-CoA reductase-like NAD-dependent aldehyde dehydrogenase